MMSKVKSIQFLILACLVVFVSGTFTAKSQDDVAEILKKFKNWRFSNVNIYKVDKESELKAIFDQVEKTGGKDAKGKSGFDKSKMDTLVLNKIKSLYDQEGGNIEVKNVIEKLSNANFANIPAEDIIKEYLESLSSSNEESKDFIFFLVTSRPIAMGKRPEDIVALVYKSYTPTQLQEEGADNIGNLKLSKILEDVSLDNIYPKASLEVLGTPNTGYPEKTGDASIIRLKKVDELTKSTFANGLSLYNNLVDYFKQGNVSNYTLEAKEIGTDVSYTGKSVGNSNSLVKSTRVTPKEIQLFKRISDGQPDDFSDKTNEILVSLDQVRWITYKKVPGLKLKDTLVFRDSIFVNKANKEDTVKIYDEKASNKAKNDNAKLLKFNSTNLYLPEFGLDLKYGIDEITYPSMWSERLTLSALWNNVKMGVILPFGNFFENKNDLFGQERKMVHGGVGIAGKIDLPMPLLPKSGIFQISGAAVFGNAVEPNYFTNPNLETITPAQISNLTAKSYFMVRANGQFHYTFGIAIDEDYLMRFGFGATLYSIEGWGTSIGKEYSQKVADTIAVYNFTKRTTETVGGISGKLEFMARNMATPFGGSIQYFDESLTTNIWLQFTILENTLSLKFEGTGYFTAFKSTPRAWENSNIFVPMARLIYLF
ncbi:MAG: hypothetical protein NTW25_09335 [Candidatus Kapabacteria bacterium]|nr:hypothetical protein [Candidatus Kapabacteria bacterium]